MEERTKFQKEQDILLTTFINSYLLNDKYTFDKASRNNYTNYHLPIELIVRPQCNQHCEYCYITQHGKELYPIEERVDNQTLLNNLDILLNYLYVEKKLFINRWELFAGDLFYDNLFFDIAEIFLKYLTPLYSTYKTLIDHTETMILMPCNCSFVTDKEKKEKYIQLKHQFEKIGWNLVISISTDGKYATNTREHQDKDEYYDNLFDFSNQTVSCFHPMISAANIDNYIENYDWWLEQFKKWYIDNPGFQIDFQPMFLEVRNDDWSQQKIDKYLELLNHMIHKRLEMCNNNIDHLAYHLFQGDGKNNTLKKVQQYDPLWLGTLDYDSRISCSIQSLLHINLNALTFSPCHRLTYKQFTGGKFICENNSIVGIESFNPEVFISTYFIDPLNMPGCANCDFNHLCMKGCLGAQYETTGELYQPAVGVCNFLKNKYLYLLDKYTAMGVIESAIKQNLITEKMLQSFNKIIEKEKEKEREEKERRKCKNC